MRSHELCLVVVTQFFEGRTRRTGGSKIHDAATFCGVCGGLLLYLSVHDIAVRALVSRTKLHRLGDDDARPVGSNLGSKQAGAGHPRGLLRGGIRAGCVRPRLCTAQVHPDRNSSANMPSTVE